MCVCVWGQMVVVEENVGVGVGVGVERLGTASG